MPATAKQSLYSRINDENDTDFNDVNTQMSAPSPFSNTDVSLRNTTILLTGVQAHGKTGSVRFYYNRKPFSALAGNAPVELEWGPEQRIIDLIPKLNTLFNIHLVESDLVDAGLPDHDEGFTSFSISAASDSYGWTGSFIVNLQAPPSNIEDEVGDTDIDDEGAGQ